MPGGVGWEGVGDLLDLYFFLLTTERRQPWQNIFVLPDEIGSTIKKANSAQSELGLGLIFAIFSAIICAVAACMDYNMNQGFNFSILERGIDKT